MAKRGHGKANVSGAGIKKGNKAGMPTHDFDAYEEYFGKEATMARRASKSMKNVDLNENASLGEELSFMDRAKRGFMTHGGRGHGRKTPHGRGKRAANQPTRREMLYFVRDAVRHLREAPAMEISDNKVQMIDGVRRQATTHDFANTLARDLQFFDCGELTDYIENNWREMYPDEKVPPSPKVILPAPRVGLYANNWPDLDPYTNELNGSFCEFMFVCTPRLNNGSTTNFSIAVISRNVDQNRNDFVPKLLGTVDSEKGVFGVSPKYLEQQKLDRIPQSLRIVAGYLQTINNPRFVRRGKKTFSQMKKQSAKKVLRDFIAEQWNMVSWNVDKAVDAKNYEEGNGGRQGLHFRRGFFRRGESHWQNVQMIDGVWRQWIEGYEAGHPAFGVKKSYHLPRIKGENK